jgi:hypothetical protein
VTVELMEAIKRRRMVRAFDPERMIDRARLSAMLELAVQAPSAGFSQGWHFTVLDDSSGRSLFWTATTDSAAPPDRWLAGMQSAPVLIVVWSERAAYDARYARFDKSPTPGPDRTLDARWPVAYWDIDAGMAALLILLPVRGPAEPGERLARHPGHDGRVCARGRARPRLPGCHTARSGATSASRDDRSGVLRSLRSKLTINTPTQQPSPEPPAWAVTAAPSPTRSVPGPRWSRIRR